MNRFDQTLVPTHWSKDFVEHLRAVHFALIAVCAGLTILITSAKTYDARVALRQVKDIIRLQEIWSQQWAFDNLGSKHFDLPRRVIPKEVISAIGTHARDEWTLDQDSELVGKMYPPEFDPEYPPYFSIPKAQWIDGRIELPTTPLLDFSAVPKTLPQFESWWNLLATSREIYIPVAVANLGEVLNNSRTREYVFLDQTRYAVHASPHIELRLGTREHGTIPSGYIGNLPNGIVLFPFTKGRILDLNQDSLGKIFNWHSGRFDRAFYDLHQAALGIESWDLQKIRDQLVEETSKGGDSFEALGIKFPVEQLTVCGALLVLSIQLYFLIYLRQLSGKLQEGDPGWDVPWMGMDQSRLARAVLFATVVIVPIGSLALLGDNAVHHLVGATPQSGRWWFRDISLGPGILGPLLATSASVLLAQQCWRFRPTVTAQPKHPDPPPTAKT
jgi:hypothetical protein